MPIGQPNSTGTDPLTTVLAQRVAANRYALEQRQNQLRLSNQITASTSDVPTPGALKLKTFRNNYALRAPKPEELTAYITVQSTPFLVISNTNRAKDDNFSLQIRPLSNSSLITVPGVMDFSADGVATTYIYLGARLTVEQFFTTEAFKEINEIIVALDVTRPVTYNSPAFRLTPNLGISTKTSAELKMQNVGQNFNGNFGNMYYGFLEDEVVYQSRWEGGDGVDIVFTDFDWQKDGNLYREEFGS
jgi:hypothetical protein